MRRRERISVYSENESSSLSEANANVPQTKPPLHDFNTTLLSENVRQRAIKRRKQREGDWRLEKRGTKSDKGMQTRKRGREEEMGNDAAAVSKEVQAIW